MSYRGSRKFPLHCKTTAILEPGRLVVVNKVTNVASYATYGSEVDGILRERTTITDAAVHPVGLMDSTQLVKLLTAATKGVDLFPAANGMAVASSYTCGTRGIAAQPSPSADAVYLLPGTVSGAGWTGHANAVAVYTHVGTSWAYVDVSDTANVGLTVYVSDEKKYYTWNGTAWVMAKSIGISDEAGVAGQEIAFYNVGSNKRLVPDALPANLNYGIMLMGQYSGNPGGTTVTILDSRIAAGDRVFISVQGGTNAGYVVRTVTTAGTITLTLSADTGANTLISYIVVKQL